MWKVSKTTPKLAVVEPESSTCVRRKDVVGALQRFSRWSATSLSTRARRSSSVPGAQNSSHSNSTSLNMSIPTWTSNLSFVGLEAARRVSALAPSSASTAARTRATPRRSTEFWTLAHSESNKVVSVLFIVFNRKSAQLLAPKNLSSPPYNSNQAPFKSLLE